MMLYILMADGSSSRLDGGLKDLEEKISELEQRGYNPRVEVLI